MQKKLNLVDIGFRISLISTLIIYIALPLENRILTQIPSKSFIFVNLISFLFCVLYKGLKKKEFLIILFIIFSAVISFLISGSSMGLYNFIVKLLGYMAIILYFYYLNFVNVDKRTINFVFIINLFIALVFILLSLSGFAYKGHHSWLTLGYDNPNQAAMLILMNIIILLGAFWYYENRIIKSIYLILILYLTQLIYLTESRTNMFILLLIFILSIGNFKIIKKVYIILFITLLPIFFLIIYPLLYKNGLFLNVEIMGKSFYSYREIMYVNIIEDLKGEFLFGNLGRYDLNNLHNVALSILGSLGLIGLVLFYLYVWQSLLTVAKRIANNRVALTAFYGILMVFLNSISESALLISGSMYASSVGTLFYLTRIDTEKNNL